MFLQWLIQLKLYIMEGKESRGPGTGGDSTPQSHIRLSTPSKRPRNDAVSQSQFGQPQNSTACLAANQRTSKAGHPVHSGTSHIFYKTRICRKFNAGSCWKGESCTYAHGREDRRPSPPGWKDSICKMRVKHCEFILRGEECPYGESCCYVHEIPSKNDMAKLTAENSDLGVNTSESVMKSKICFKWDREGQCAYGERCCFMHGQPGVVRHGNSSSEVITSIRSAERVIPGLPPLIPDPTGEKKLIFNRKKIIGIYADWI